MNADEPRFTGCCYIVAKNQKVGLMEPAEKVNSWLALAEQLKGLGAQLYTQSDLIPSGGGADQKSLHLHFCAARWGTFKAR